MARIRSIKPEFWKDGRIARLSKDCALFFIGLWNFCDDEGKARADARELSLNLPLFRSQDIVKHLSRLTECGLVQLSVDREWIVVVNWKHQKIDKPKQPEVLKSEIEWSPILRESNSSNALRTIGDDSSNARRKDRIGSDRIGSDRITPAGVNPDGNAPVPAKKKSDHSKNIPTWESYREAYSRRYGTAPIRNASVNAKVAQFVNRIGTEESPLVAEFYLTHNDAYYVKSMHPVGLLLRDAEKLRTEWATGRKMLGSTARDVERMQHNSDVWDQAAADMRAKRSGA